MSTLHQSASEILVFMMLAVEPVAAEEVDVSMSEVVTKGVEEEVDELEEDTSKEVVKVATVHIKMELTFHMSLVTLKIQSKPHSQTIQGKRSLRTQYA